MKTERSERCILSPQPTEPTTYGRQHCRISCIAIRIFRSYLSFKLDRPDVTHDGLPIFLPHQRKNAKRE